MSYQPPNQPPYPPQQPPYQQLPKKKWGTLFWILIIGGALLVCVACSGMVAAVSHVPPPPASTATPTATPDMAATNIAAAQATQNAASPYSNTPVNTGYTPPPSPKWTTTHTFKGNGSKKTGTFSVPDDWKIVWKCNPASFGIDYNVIVTVYNSDGSYADSGVNSTCSPKNTHDETEVHTSGDVYLDIVSEGDWVITVQELK